MSDVSARLSKILSQRDQALTSLDLQGTSGHGWQWLGISHIDLDRWVYGHLSWQRCPCGCES